MISGYLTNTCFGYFKKVVEVVELRRTNNGTYFLFKKPTKKAESWRKNRGNISQTLTKKEAKDWYIENFNWEPEKYEEIFNTTLEKA